MIHRVTETFRRARPLIQPFIGFLFLGAFGALAVGLVSHFAVIVPLENNLLSAEVRSLATELDSTVRMRSALIRITVGNSELDSFLQSGGLDKMLYALRQQFPDFLSFEATNDRGQVQAMGGELALSQAGLFSKAPSGKITTVDLGDQLKGGTFHDDPQGNCYYITCKHVGSGGGKWFTRTRFTRESVAAILKSTPTRRVTLVPISGASKDIPGGPPSLTMPQSRVVRTIGSWWRGPTGAEALLTMPSWLLRMEDPATRSFLWRAQIAVPLCLILCSVIATIILKRASLLENQGRDEAADAATGGRFPPRCGTASTEPESCRKSAVLHERKSEIPATMGEDHSTSDSGAEHGSPAVCKESLESEYRADVPGVTKLVTIPVNKSPVEITDKGGQELCSDYLEEDEKVPDTLEVCWFEPCEPCETDNPQRVEMHERTGLLYEEEGSGSRRSPASGHILSISG